MNSPLRKISIILFVGFLGMQSFGKPGPPHNKMVTTKKGGWHSLFDGKSLSGWHAFNKKGAIKSWTVIDGTLACLGASADTKDDIVTDKEYANFELSWSWKIDKGSNSGVLYHVVEGQKYQTTYETGPEYQLIDDNGYPEKLEYWQKTGADYAMHLTNEQKKVNPVGEWNTSKIIFNRGHVEHWLNGKKILEFEAWSDDWNKKKAAGKWKDYPAYGLAKTGHIVLQDHGDKVYFKEIKIRALGD